MHLRASVCLRPFYPERLLLLARFLRSTAGIGSTTVNTCVNPAAENYHLLIGSAAMEFWRIQMSAKLLWAIQEAFIRTKCQ